ncbi:MAG: IclR family transcriptional regulator [Acidobacteria bacterium]|nr:IclR family transcriptional regulator [Acidobacteriota bacterium]
MFTIVNTNSGTSTVYQAPTVKKAFQILELVAGKEKHPTISDLSRELGISKSTVHGITRALEEAGALYRDRNSKRYNLGTALFELARMGYARIDLKDAARPVMEKLMRATGQSVFLGIRSGSHVSIVDIVESAQNLKITSPIGTRVPLLAGALGKAFLASMDDKRAMSLIRSIGLRGFTGNSVTDPDRYMEMVDEARASGWGLDDEEYIQGVRAAAAVIRRSGQPTAAVWVVGFTPSMGADRMLDIARETRRAAEAIAKRIASHSFDGQKP